MATTSENDETAIHAVAQHFEDTLELLDAHPERAGLSEPPTLEDTVSALLLVGASSLLASCEQAVRETGAEPGALLELRTELEQKWSDITTRIWKSVCAAMPLDTTGEAVAEATEQSK